MEQTPIFYTPEQMEEILHFIRETFGEGGKYNAHEVSSKYVHTDVAIIAPEGEGRTFVTFGMGARPMNSPFAEWERTELVMFASDGLDLLTKEGIAVAQELTGLSKYPFREDTWFGPGHTIDASEAFRETFGYDSFLFFGPGIDTHLTDVGNVKFLIAIPIYREEREWIMEHDSFTFLEALLELPEEDLFCADVRRESLISDNP